jgi:hypothetical protein
MVALFVLVRAINRYGDPTPWAPQKNAVFTLMSFVNTTKYPPSLDFLLMTLGPAILLLAWLDRLTVSPRNFVVVFGRVPMFYYLLHFLVRDLVGAVVFFGHFGGVVGKIHPPFDFPPGLGFGLPGVYLAWAAVVLLLYWPCLRFGRYKRAHPEKIWLSYL